MPLRRFTEATSTTLSFRDKWPEKKGKNMYINILEIETVWKGFQKFEDEMKGKTISFLIDNTTAVACLLKEGCSHCKTLNTLMRKILLKCYRSRVAHL